MCIRDSVGVEDLTFEGRSKENFGHHASWEDDGAYKPLNMMRLTDSWIRRVDFRGVSEALSIVSSANCSAYDIETVSYTHLDVYKRQYWDYDAPNIPNEPRDVSTAAIIASAFYEMYTYTGDGLYKQKADRIVESLSSPAYRAPVGGNGGFLLMHSVGSIPHGSNIDVPLNYADYYFLEALIRKGRLEAGEPLF